MKKLIGVSIAFRLVLYGALLLDHPKARSRHNHINLANRIGINGMLCLAVTPLIHPWRHRTFPLGPLSKAAADSFGYHTQRLRNGILTSPVVTVLSLGPFIGLSISLLITKLRLQPFIVTLCGLFIYRGLARWIANDGIKGLDGTFTEYI